MKRQLLILATTLLLLPTPAHGAEDSLGLARRLAEAEPELAVTEYLRVLYHAKDPSASRLVREELGRLYQKLGRETDAQTLYQQARDGADAIAHARLSLRLIELLARRDPLLAQVRLEAMLDQHPTGPLREEVLRRLWWTQLTNRAYRPAAETIRHFEKTDAQASALAAELEARATRPGIAPGQAMLATALFPGSGQAYMGEWSKGLGSLLLNGALVGVGYYAVRERDWFAGLVLLDLVPRYYFGGIRAAGELAEARQAREHEAFQADLKARYPSFVPRSLDN
ncbi:hypothetical protein J7643_03310 [bacterium]|nr:hypothetical protein [bacterium]